VAEREADIVKHSKAAAFKQSKRQENELYGEIADLRLSLQRREAELQTLEVCNPTSDNSDWRSDSRDQSALKTEAAELRSTLGAENSRLKTQLEEVLVLHEDIRQHRDGMHGGDVIGGGDDRVSGGGGD
jgi:hypothetical protein